MAAHHVTGGAGMVVGPLGLERHLRYWSRPRQGGEPQPPGGPGYLPSKTHLTIISPSHHHLTISPSSHHLTIVSPSHHHLTGLPALQNPSHHLHPTFSLSLSSSWRWHLPIYPSYRFYDSSFLSHHINLTNSFSLPTYMETRKAHFIFSCCLHLNCFIIQIHEKFSPLRKQSL